MKTSCLRLKLVELNLLVSFNTDDQSKTNVTNTVNIITYLVKHVHTLVKLCVVKQKVRLLTILDFFSILVSDSFPGETISQSKELSMAPLLSLRIKFY